MKKIKSTTFSIHVLEPPSGFVFVLKTENKVTKSLDSHLKHIYKNIFVEMVSKNPTQDPHGKIKSKVCVCVGSILLTHSLSLSLSLYLPFVPYTLTTTSLNNTQPLHFRNLRMLYVAILNQYFSSKKSKVFYFLNGPNFLTLAIIINNKTPTRTLLQLKLVCCYCSR